MSEQIIFDYYYGSQAEQFSFYRLPRTLIKDKRFKKLSSDAKILYGIMLDRMSLSIKNRWVDQENRVYIIFTLEEVMEAFDCSERKAGYLLSELDTKSGVGLIEKKRQGLGKPNLIFLKNFQIPEDYSSFAADSEIHEEQAAAGAYKGGRIQRQEEQCLHIQSSNPMPARTEKGLPIRNGQILPIQSSKNLQVQSSKNMQVQSSKNEQIQSGKKLPVQISKNEQMQSSNNLPFQSSKDLPTNYTNHNQIDYNQVKSINPSNVESRTKNSLEQEMQIYYEIIKENVDYDCLIHDYASNVNELKCMEEILELIVETICVQCETVRIAGKDYPYQIVKRRLLNIRYSHILYVLDCLNKNTTKVRNIRAYLLTALFNSTATIKNYYRAEVNHEIFGGKK